MAELKTRPGDDDVAAFIAGIADEQRRADCAALAALMGELAGEAPTLWGGSIVGFGRRQYRYASGHSGEWFNVGFAPRKQSLTLYFSFSLEQQATLLARLGRHKLGKGCLYLQRLGDADDAALRELIQLSLPAPS